MATAGEPNLPKTLARFPCRAGGVPGLFAAACVLLRRRDHSESLCGRLFPDTSGFRSERAAAACGIMGAPFLVDHCLAALLGAPSQPPFILHDPQHALHWHRSSRPRACPATTPKTPSRVQGKRGAATSPTGEVREASGRPRRDKRQGNTSTPEIAFAHRRCHRGDMRSEVRRSGEPQSTSRTYPRARPPR